MQTDILQANIPLDYNLPVVLFHVVRAYILLLYYNLRQ